MFVSFEGIDGSGKTTLAGRLYEKLIAEGADGILTREPGGCPAGEEIRKLILEPGCDLPADAEVFLFLASQCVNTVNRILPALMDGKTVISDRFYHSILAYQCYGKGYDRAFVERLCRTALRSLAPDVTFLLDITVDEAAKRFAEPDRFTEDTDFLERVRRGFLELAEEEPERIVIIDAGLPLEVKLDIVTDKLYALGTGEKK